MHRYACMPACIGKHIFVSSHRCKTGILRMQINIRVLCTYIHKYILAFMHACINMHKCKYTYKIHRYTPQHCNTFSLRKHVIKHSHSLMVTRDEMHIHTCMNITRIREERHSPCTHAHKCTYADIHTQMDVWNHICMGTCIHSYAYTCPCAYRFNKCIPLYPLLDSTKT